mmetsp:Transcript_38618/g.83894  ORF Transcript_38618/g.83894 Transcript_38618/m.83894 type:complete len:194 (-) Transcript_38618:569-1150(-)
MPGDETTESNGTTTSSGSAGPRSMSALFEDGTAFDMKDKVSAIHSHFDRDDDGHLNYSELRSLQLATSGADMTPEQYKQVCVALNCHFDKGLCLNALKFTYASEGADVDEDYRKVFPPDDKVNKKKKTTTTKEKRGKKSSSSSAAAASSSGQAVAAGAVLLRRDGGGSGGGGGGAVPSTSGSSGRGRRRKKKA